VEEYNDLSTYLSIELVNSDREPEVLAVEQRKDDQIVTMFTYGYLTTGILPTDERYTCRMIWDRERYAVFYPKRQLKRCAVVPSHLKE